MFYSNQLLLLFLNKLTVEKFAGSSCTFVTTVLPIVSATVICAGLEVESKLAKTAMPNVSVFSSSISDTL